MIKLVSPYQKTWLVMEIILNCLQNILACFFGFVLMINICILDVFLVMIAPLYLMGMVRMYERMTAWICQMATAVQYTFVIYYTRLRGFQYGDEYVEPGHGDKHIFLSNHQSWCDVPILSGIFFHTTGVGSSTWVCWRALLKLPFMWASWLKGDAFIPCIWNEDKPILEQHFDHFLSSSTQRTYVLFPEGAIRSRHSIKKSKAYCSSIGIEPLQHVLMPRSKAFSLALMKLKKFLKDQRLANGKVSPVNAKEASCGDGYLYDLTIGYAGFPGKVPRVLDMFIRRKNPIDLHIHFRRYLISSLPEDDDGLRCWLQKRYIEKDELMKCFFAHEQFPTSSDGQGALGHWKEHRPPDYRGFILTFTWVVVLMTTYFILYFYFV